KAQLARCVLLQLARDEWRHRISFLFAPVDPLYDEARLLEVADYCLDCPLIGDRPLLALEASGLGGKIRRELARKKRSQIPVFYRFEFPNLPLAFHDHAERDSLHASC